MRKRVTEEQARATAEWWGSFLHEDFNHNNGDLLQSAVMNKLSDSGDYTEEQIRTFVETLTEDLVNRPVRVNVKTDYYPDKTLRNALEEAGIEITQRVLPVKSRCFIHWQRVRAQAGYNGKWETIYEAPDYPPLTDMISADIELTISPGDEEDIGWIERTLSNTSELKDQKSTLRELEDIHVDFVDDHFEVELVGAVLFVTEFSSFYGEEPREMILSYLDTQVIAIRDIEITDLEFEYREDVTVL